MLLFTFVFIGLTESIIKLKNEMSQVKRLLLTAVICSFLCGLINGTLSTCFDFSVVLSGTVDNLNIFMQQLLCILFLIEIWILFSAIFTEKKICIPRISLCAGTALTLVICLVFAGSSIERRRDMYCKVDRDGIVISKSSALENRCYIAQRGLVDDPMISLLPQLFPDCNLYIYYKASGNKAHIPRILCGEDCCIKSSCFPRVIIFPCLPPDTIPSGIIKIILDQYDEAGSNRQWRNFAKRNSIPLQYFSRQI